jgi:hypothetical protein
MASVWAFDDEEPWAEATRLERTVGPTLESWGLLDFAGNDLPYETYGKSFVLVYALMVPAMRILPNLPGRRRYAGGFEAWSWRVTFGALIAAGAGDFVAYWGASLPGVLGYIVSAPGFTVEFIAMPILVFASGAYGLAAMLSRGIPRWIAGMLIAAPVTSIATSLLVTNYVPNAVVVPLSVIWGVIGAWLVVTGGGTVRTDDAIMA